MCACYVASVMSDSLHTWELQAPKLLCLWSSPGKNTAVVCRALQGVVPTRGSKPSLLFPALAGRFFTTSASCKSYVYIYIKIYILYWLYTLSIYTHTHICIYAVLVITPVSQTTSIYVWSVRELCLTLCDPTYRCINIDIQVIDIKVREPI